MDAVFHLAERPHWNSKMRWSAEGAMRKNEIDPAEPLLYSIINAVYSGSPAVSIPIDNFTVNRNCGMLIYIFEEDALCESRSSHAIRDHD